MTSRSTACTPGVKCSLQAPKGSVGGDLRPEWEMSLFLGEIIVMEKCLATKCGESSIPSLWTDYLCCEIGT